MKKVVLKLEIFDDKEKKKAMKTVSGLSGIESIAISMKDKKVTIIGDVDPIDVVNKLRKLWHTELLSVGPAKEAEKEAENKKKVDKKDGNNKKVVLSWNLQDQNEQIQDLMPAYPSYDPYIMRPYVAQENPNGCVIC